MEARGMTVPPGAKRGVTMATNLSGPISRRVALARAATLAGLAGGLMVRRRRRLTTVAG